MAHKTDCAIMVEPLSEADGGGWLASVPALPGCLGDGETPDAALGRIAQSNNPSRNDFFRFP